VLLAAAAGRFWLLRLVLQFMRFDLRPLPSKLIAVVFGLAAASHLSAAFA